MKTLNIPSLLKLVSLKEQHKQNLGKIKSKILESFHVGKPL